MTTNNPKQLAIVSLGLLLIAVIALAMDRSAVEGASYAVLLESDADLGAGQEVFLASYNSFANLLSDTKADPGSFSQLNVNPAYSVGGLVAIYDNSGGGNGSVPEPPTVILALIAVSLFGIGYSTLGQKKVATYSKPRSGGMEAAHRT
jgi:hypothetical protein